MEASVLNHARDLRCYIVYTDGASRGNPGPSAIGVLVTDAEGTVLRRLGKRIGRATNNQAEYRAFIVGLEAALGLGAEVVKVYLDSELAVRQVKGYYRVRNPGLRPLFNRVISLSKKFSAFDIAAIPRAENRVADALANAALDGNEIDFQYAP